MKQLLSLFLALNLLALTAMASTYEQQYIHFNKLTQERKEALKGNNISKNIQVLEASYYAPKDKLAKSANITEEEFNAKILETLVMNCTNKYYYSKEPKYFKKTVKYSNLAILSKTKNLSIVETAIFFNYLNMDEKKIVTGYEYLCSLDNKKCEEYRKFVPEIVSNIKDLKAKATEVKKEKIRNVIAMSLYCIGNAASAYGQAYSNNLRNQITCQTVGTYTYCY